MPLLVLTACTKQEASKTGLKDFEAKVYNGEEHFMNAVVSTKEFVEEENIVYIDFSYDTDKDLYAISTISQSKLDHFVIDLRTSKLQDSDTVYNVDCCCNEDGGDLWSEECDSAFACGTIINKCLKADGCATICTASIVYYPPINLVRVLRN